MSIGGHTNFGPRNRNEFELMEFIRKKRNVDHVSTEMLVSGTAIPYYYMYYAEKYPHLSK